MKMGVETIAAAIGEERDTIEDSIEPYLIQQDYSLPKLGPLNKIDAIKALQDPVKEQGVHFTDDALIEKTPRGRILTDTALQHIGP